jgi:RNA polymerase sigma-70 factor (ECF subfamily)
VDTRLEQFEANRARLFGLAYRMLGEAAEAEDIVQDAYLRWRKSGNVAVPASWLTTVVTNLCLSRLTSARARREQYVGPWLPEPVYTGREIDDPAQTVEQRDSLSIGMLVLLERLTPPERAAFVLHSAFDYSHREIAGVLGIQETYARQLYHRALTHIGARQRFTATPEKQRAIVERFLAAALDGDVAQLEQLLTADAVAWSDGGGKVTTTLHPAVGRDRVIQLLTSLATTDRAAATTLTIEPINGSPAILVHEDGQLTVVVMPDLTDDGIIAIHAVLNPDKLAFAATQLENPG